MRNHNRGFMLAALVVLLAVASNSMLAAGGSGIHTIERVKVYPNGKVHVWSADGDWRNPDFCDESTRVIMVPPDPNAPSDKGFKERFTTVLAAHLTAREIDFRLDGCKLVGSTSFPRTNGVSV